MGSKMTKSGQKLSLNRDCHVTEIEATGCWLGVRTGTVVGDRIGP